MIVLNTCRALVGTLVLSTLWLNVPADGQVPANASAAAPAAQGAPSTASAAQVAAPAAVPNPQPASNLDRAKFAVQTMQKTYTLDTGLYKTTGWWNAANAITTLADYARVAKTHAYDFVFSNTLYAAQKKFPGFINEYYDDEGWWLLAWVDAYDDTRDARYLDTAKLIFQDMIYGWNDDSCGGGVWWSKDRRDDNAIENELFLASAASLANRTTGAQRVEYLGWAKKEWNWFSRSGMINEKHLINDGLKECKNNGKKTWSYNQGVILGGLVELHKADHDASLLAQANEIAQATIANLTDSNGILRDGCETQQRRNNAPGPHCGNDATQFKGVFVRNLRILAAADPHGSQYNNFIQKNADSIWSQTAPDYYQLGEGWAAPFGGLNASTQSSALDVLVAAAAISRK